ncbi:Bacterial regulatory protein, tetR family [compost metagenome]
MAMAPPEALARTPVRQRNAEATRSAILEAAGNRFATECYEDVGMRDIARDVGVDAAMVARYFGSKAELFTRVLQSCGSAHELIAGDRQTFGRRLAQEIVFGAERTGKLKALQIILRSLGSAKARDIIRASTADDFLAPFTGWIGGPEARIRARLVSGLLMGMAVDRELDGGYGLDTVESVGLCHRLAAALQAWID